MNAMSLQVPTTVVKLGGSCLDSLGDLWWDDLARQGQERPLILVHGWSCPLQKLSPHHRRTSAILRDRYGNQSRWTTPKVLDDIKTVSSALSEGILSKLAKRDVTAERLLGSDQLIVAGPGERLWWQGKRLIEMENLVGPPISVNTVPLERTQPGHISLVTPLARNAAGHEVNTDADRAAAAVAAAVGAADLVLVTDVPHLIVEGEPVHRITQETASSLRDRVATGGMRKKLRAACEALDHSVERVVIGNSTITALLTGHTGTVITRA
jgi:acetylglutamate kinase/acetylglutamate/LysW-gamma-L-alpha-aminoadipate kinase